MEQEYELRLLGKEVGGGGGLAGICDGRLMFGRDRRLQTVKELFRLCSVSRPLCDALTRAERRSHSGAVVRCSVSGLVLIIIPDLGLIRATQDIPMDRAQCGF